MAKNRQGTGNRGNPNPKTEHLKKFAFKKGEPSRNPGGRPKNLLLTSAFRRALGEIVPFDDTGRTWADFIADKQVRKAAMGSNQHVRELADRTEGRPRQTIEFRNPDREQLQMLSDEELERIAAGLPRLERKDETSE